MTNPNANDLLRLARAVYPDAQIEIVCGEVHVSWRSPLPLADGSHPVLGLPFDPANNSEQFCEVLAWLLSPALSLAHPEKAFFTVTSWNVLRSRFIDDCLGPVTMFSVGHNGTPAGIRAAVVDAAVRVAGGGQ